ncbi:hypothetical protein [Telluribacter humicola]|uniref:hypothetical protein n=1 Tax=Telluribacter humicola TaxID=1720261 RepID=UPI001A96B7C6|nr:hypothetical protein [Telluribacter humicola]
MKNGNKINYMVSQGKGQYFKRDGDFVKIVCIYDFNPSIERTKYNQAMIEALHCEPCTEEDFLAAERSACQLLGLPTLTPTISHN